MRAFGQTQRTEAKPTHARAARGTSVDICVPPSLISPKGERGCARSVDQWLLRSALRVGDHDVVFAEPVLTTLQSHQPRKLGRKALDLA